MTEKVKVLHVDGSESWAIPQSKHPARYSAEIVDVMVEELCARDWPGKLVLDPFAGTGERLGEIRDRVREHRRPKIQTTGVELEPEWVACAPFGDVLVGNSMYLPLKWSNRFGAVITSPCYGNRFADSHENRDKCKRCDGEGVVWSLGDQGAQIVCPLCKGSKLSVRRSYTHDLGRKLDPNNAGAMHYGERYRALHRAVWEEVFRVLKPGGLFILNIKDHVRDHKRIRVSEWHRRTILKLGFEVDGRGQHGMASTILVPLGGLRHGANRIRIPNEIVYVFRKPE
jgi:tRNA G10  N-methylase Trm11